MRVADAVSSRYRGKISKQQFPYWNEEIQVYLE